MTRVSAGVDEAFTKLVRVADDLQLQRAARASRAAST